ncbi:MAG: hypothetical protein H0U35_04630 [Sporichthyaceae bacterium]|nr:hypothetical protein [Sporichthyaceae bacterium]
MPETAVVARSPIAPAPPETVVAGWVVSGRRSTAGLVLTDCTPLAKVAVKATPHGAMQERLHVPFGRAARRSPALQAPGDALLVIGSGPGEWLVVAPPGAQSRLLEQLNAAAAGVTELVTLLDITHGRALVRLTGDRSPDLLAKECGLDLADAVVRNGSALRTAVAKLATDLVRDDRDGVRSYLLHCERSSGQYLFDALRDAGREFGVDVTGFEPAGI